MSDQSHGRDVPGALTGPYRHHVATDERPEDEESTERLDEDYDIATAREQVAENEHHREPQEGPAVVDGS